MLSGVCCSYHCTVINQPASVVKHYNIKDSIYLPTADYAAGAVVEKTNPAGEDFSTSIIYLYAAITSQPTRTAKRNKYFSPHHLATLVCIFS